MYSAHRHSWTGKWSRDGPKGWAWGEGGRYGGTEVWKGSCFTTWCQCVAWQWEPLRWETRGSFHKIGQTRICIVLSYDRSKQWLKTEKKNQNQKPHRLCSFLFSRWHISFKKVVFFTRGKSILSFVITCLNKWQKTYTVNKYC